MVAISVKIIRDGEIRRFQLESEDEKKFSYRRLADQVIKTFPDLANSTLDLEARGLRLTWKDDDNDFVLISNDSDLIEAIRNSHDQTLRIYATKNGDKPQPAARVDEEQEDTDWEEPAGHGRGHRGVFCNICHQGINGIRFKCLICPDYDLCSICVDTTTHDEHPMIRIVSPKDKSWKIAFKATQKCGGLRKKRHNSSRSRSHSPRRRHFSHHGHFPSPFLGQGLPPFGQLHRPPCEPGSFPAWFCGTGIGHGPSERKFGKRHPMSKGGCRKGNQHRHCWTQHMPWFQEKGDVTGKEAKEDDQANDGEHLNDLWNDFNCLMDLADHRESHSEDHAAKEATVSAEGKANGTPNDPKIVAALNYMLAMGYTNEGGWLITLLEKHKGDVSAVLDVLHPTPKN